MPASANWLHLSFDGGNGDDEFPYERTATAGSVRSLAVANSDDGGRNFRSADRRIKAAGSDTQLIINGNSRSAEGDDNDDEAAEDETADDDSLTITTTTAATTTRQQLMTQTDDRAAHDSTIFSMTASSVSF